MFLALYSSSSGGLNCNDAASGIVTFSQWPSGEQVERELKHVEDYNKRTVK